MKPIKRVGYLLVWFFRSIFQKLSPVRRLLLFLAFLFMLGLGGEPQPFSAFCLIFLILVLELKDKLLAHDELRAGKAVQTALRPAECPDISGWEVFFHSASANHVGGDLVDCFPYGDGVAFTFGDVSGKGLAAALLMAQIQASARILAQQNNGASAAKWVQELNRFYCRQRLASTFISFIFLPLRPNCGEIALVNAGHHPPLLLRDGEVSELPKGGPALGLTPRTLYSEISIHLDKGDALALYTDGVTDARNAAGEFFGDERLLNLLRRRWGESAETLGKSLVEALDRFVGRAPRMDDATLLILRRKE